MTAVTSVVSCNGTPPLLQAKLNESIDKLRNLESNKKALEEDIAVKTNSLNIDQSQCLRLRKTLVWRRHEISF